MVGSLLMPFKIELASPWFAAVPDAFQLPDTLVAGVAPWQELHELHSVLPRPGSAACAPWVAASSAKPITAQRVIAFTVCFIFTFLFFLLKIRLKKFVKISQEFILLCPNYYAIA